MPLKLSVGLSKKVGLPNYSSLGASCHVELELDSQLLARDPIAFHEQVQQSFEACSQAVQEELHRQVPSAHQSNGHSSSTGEHAQEQSDDQADDQADEQVNGQSANGEFDPGRSWSSSRRATAAQVRAIFAIANRQKLDLPQELQSRFSMDRPDDLSVAEASRFIDELQARADGAGGCR